MRLKSRPKENGIVVLLKEGKLEIFVGGAKVLGTIQTSNGVINVVDKVILPQEK